MLTIRLFDPCSRFISFLYGTYLYIGDYAYLFLVFLTRWSYEPCRTWEYELEDKV